MAKVTKETREEQVTVTKEVTVVNLALTEEEAETLAAVLYLVGGPPSGPRGRMTSILRGLESQGYLGSNFKTEDGLINRDLIDGSIYFE